MKKLFFFCAIAFFTYFAGGSELNLSVEGREWLFRNGPEFPGAQGMLQNQNGMLLLSGDFTNGGRYVEATLTEKFPLFQQFTFEVKGPGRKVVLRFLDSEQQTHQYYLPLSGNPEKWQQISCSVEKRSPVHWGGKNDGQVRGKIRKISLLLHADDMLEKVGTLQFRNLLMKQIKVNMQPIELDKLFIAPDSSEPIQMKIQPDGIVLKPEEMSFLANDYTGKTVFSGEASFLPKEGILLLPPPQKTGYYDIVFPALDIRTAIVVNLPVSGPADDYFGIDVAMTRGGFDSSRFNELFRILYANNIGWIRDRFTFGTVQPEEKRFDFVNAHDGRYQKLREAAAHENLKLLDTFHDAPLWNEVLAHKKRSAVGNNLFPRNLLVAAEGLDTIARKWQLPALEVWNEPDIDFGNGYPAEFVTALTKAVSLQCSFSNNKTRLVGGVFAGLNVNFYQSCIANGMLDYVDVISYHNYSAVEKVEKELLQFREIENKSNSSRAGIPYWITECGMPWPHNELRATPEADRHSAAQIIGKAVEYRALGVERYFAFVYKFYHEGVKNFGMMDANGAPMRSMAAYAHLVRVLAHKKYVGDLNIAGTSRSRVFTDDKEIIACLYVPCKTNASSTFLALPQGLEVHKLEGADGRPLKFEGKRIPVGDEIVYLYLNKIPESLLNRKTSAMHVYQQARNYRSIPRCTKPIVIQPDYELPGNIHHHVFLDSNKEFHCQVWLNNLSGKTVSVEPAITLPEGLRAMNFPVSSFELPPKSRQKLEFTIQALGKIGHLQVPIKVDDRNGNATPLVMFLSQPPFGGRELEFPAMQEVKGWRENSAGKMTIRRNNVENALEFVTTFPVEVDRWSYPEFLLPVPRMLKNAIGIGFEMKLSPPDQLRQMLLMAVYTDEKEVGEAIKIPIPIQKPDTADWEYRIALFPHNVSPEKIRMLRLGVNALTEEARVMIRNVKVFYSH